MDKDALEKFKKDFASYLNTDQAKKQIAEWEAECERKATENTAHLLPCPCCGGKPLRGMSPDSWGVYDTIYCEDCGLTAQDQYMGNNCDEIWQKRVTPN